jgi:hypothetical protein
MNANELADELDKLPSEYLMEEWVYKAQAMLREQQVRIEQLLETQDYLYKRHDEQQAENQFFKDLMGDVEILRKAQEK